jgi:hypothetical protein
VRKDCVIDRIAALGRARKTTRGAREFANVGQTRAYSDASVRGGAQGLLNIFAGVAMQRSVKFTRRCGVCFLRHTLILTGVKRLRRSATRVSHRRAVLPGLF